MSQFTSALASPIASLLTTIPSLLAAQGAENQTRQDNLARYLDVQRAGDRLLATQNNQLAQFTPQMMNALGAQGAAAQGAYDTSYTPSWAQGQSLAMPNQGQQYFSPMNAQTGQGPQSYGQAGTAPINPTTGKSQANLTKSVNGTTNAAPQNIPATQSQGGWHLGQNLQSILSGGGWSTAPGQIMNGIMSGNTGETDQRGTPQSNPAGAGNDLGQNSAGLYGGRPDTWTGPQNLPSYINSAMNQAGATANQGPNLQSMPKAYDVRNQSAMQDFDTRTGQLQNAYQNLYGGGTQNANSPPNLMQNWQDNSQKTLNNWDQGMGAVTKGYQDRYSQGMGLLKGYGDQQQADLKQQYANLGSQQQAGLTSAGLGGTTVGASMQAGNQRLQQADMNRLNESINQQKLGWNSQLSGDALNAQQNQAQGYNALLGQQQTGASNLLQGLVGQSLGVQNTNMNNRFNINNAMQDATLQSMAGQNQGAANAWGNNMSNMLGAATNAYGTYTGQNTNAAQQSMQNTWNVNNPMPDTSSALNQAMLAGNNLGYKNYVNQLQNNQGIFGSMFGSTMGAAGNVGGAALLGSMLKPS